MEYPYKTKQTLERLNFETLYFFKNQEEETILKHGGNLLLSPQCFPIYGMQKSPLKQDLFLLSANAFNWLYWGLTPL